MVSYFDDLPLQLGRRREPVLSEMVRYLMGKPNSEDFFSQFVRTFHGAREVLLKPFFNFRTPARGRCLISLRTIDGALCDLVKAHIDDRLELTCKHGHRLIKVGGSSSGGGLSTVVCFSCNFNDLGQCYYSCAEGCVFHVCQSCMVFRKIHGDGISENAFRKVDDVGDPVEKSPAKRLCVSRAVSSLVACAADASSSPVLICIIRGHVLRRGDRLCQNAHGDWQDLHMVFGSIQTQTEKIHGYELIFLLDVVVMGANDCDKEEILRVVSDYVSLRCHRISSRPLGDAQPDSLLKTFEWEQGQLADIDMSPVVGYFVFRADCYLKRMVELQSWVERGIEYRMTVFPFMVFLGAPADQLFFIPTSCRSDFVRSLQRLTLYKLDGIQRQSLHYIHCKKALGGRLKFHMDVICDANSTKEWNPYYRIVGRTEMEQEDIHRTKWGRHWFGEAVVDGETGSSVLCE